VGAACARATFTVTLCRLKRGLIGRHEFTGELTARGIGVPDVCPDEVGAVAFGRRR
jgi:hypothetical protein